MPAIISRVYQSRPAGGSFWGPGSIPQAGDLVQGILCGFALPGEAAWPQSACLQPSCVWTHNHNHNSKVIIKSRCFSTVDAPNVCSMSAAGPRRALPRVFTRSRSALGAPSTATCPEHCILGLAQISLCSCSFFLYQLLPLHLSPRCGIPAVTPSRPRTPPHPPQHPLLSSEPPVALTSPWHGEVWPGGHA